MTTATATMMSMSTSTSRHNTNNIYAQFRIGIHIYKHSETVQNVNRKSVSSTKMWTKPCTQCNTEMHTYINKHCTFQRKYYMTKLEMPCAFVYLIIKLKNWLDSVCHEISVQKPFSVCVRNTRNVLWSKREWKKKPVSISWNCVRFR